MTTDGVLELAGISIFRRFRAGLLTAGTLVIFASLWYCVHTAGFSTFGWGSRPPTTGARPLYYSLVDLGSFIPVGLNNRGEALGWVRRPSNTDPNKIAWVLWKEGRFQDLALPLRDEPEAFNSSGQIVGNIPGSVYEHRSMNDHAFVWQNGVAKRVGEGYWHIKASSINDAGQVVGDLENGAGYLFTPGAGGGTIQRIDWSANHQYIETRAVNDHGDVAGKAGRWWNSDDQFAFLWRNGRPIRLSALPGDIQSAAIGMNNRGQVVGSSFRKIDHPSCLGCCFTELGDTGRLPFGAQRLQHAVLWEAGKVRNLGTLGGKCSIAVSVNDGGQVVGCSTTRDDPKDVYLLHTLHAFLCSDGRMRDLNSLVRLPQGWMLRSAIKINQNGVILGTAFVNEELRSYLLVPNH